MKLKKLKNTQIINSKYISKNNINIETTEGETGQQEIPITEESEICHQNIKINPYIFCSIFMYRKNNAKDTCQS